ncbi:MAG TPA: toll/interleukin-1 receptor domain-containing protein [Ktedonobacteraceae bacterium]|nr:toll/interleukin-1 receptor domain-containing protein [Ktedonobacteraceae bacterium]
MGAYTEIYFLYANEDKEDKKMRERLEKQLAPLVRQGITIWYPDKVLPGGDTQSEINAHLARAHVILLLISDSFISSPECSQEVERAMERHEASEARVLPILLRPVNWESASFGKLAPLPANKEFITLWQNQDAAFLNIMEGIRRVVEVIQGEKQDSDDASLIEKRDLYEILVRLN